jgi:P27 family predicted phage terminase small subunit
MKTNKTKPAPNGLSNEAKQFWNNALRDHDIADCDLYLLRAMCESWDLLQSATAQLKSEGLTIAGRGGPKAHPAAVVARDSRTAFSSIFKQLGLCEEVKPKPMMGRPPNSLKYHTSWKDNGS